MQIGQKIKTARVKKGLTQEALAEKVGVQKSAVAKWENGRVSEIRRSNLLKLAKVLSIDPNSLLDNAEEEQEKPAINNGITENQRLLIELAKNVPDDKAELLLQVMKSIVEAD